MSGARLPFIRSHLLVCVRRLAGFLPAFMATVLALPIPYLTSMMHGLGRQPVACFGLCPEPHQSTGVWSRSCLLVPPWSAATRSQLSFDSLRDRLPVLQTVHAASQRLLYRYALGLCSAVHRTFICPHDRASVVVLTNRFPAAFVFSTNAGPHRRFGVT